MLPCNVIVQELAPGKVEVAAIGVDDGDRQSGAARECQNCAWRAGKSNPVSVRFLTMLRVRLVMSWL